MDTTQARTGPLPAAAQARAETAIQPYASIAIKRRSRLKSTLRAFVRDKLAIAAAVVLAVVVVLSLSAPGLPLDDPTAADPTVRLKPPGTDGHLFGLDYQGRDMLSRLIWGGRVSLPAAVLPVILASVVGLTLGLGAGYARGFVESAVMRVIDVLFAVPDVILAIAIAAAMGAGFISVLAATTLVIIAPLTRIAYASTREHRGAEYVLAARAIGTPFGQIVRRHLLPNVLAPVLISATTIIGLLVVFTSTLSVLGSSRSGA